MNPRAILAYGAAFVVISQILVLSSYNLSELSFCWSRDCLLNTISYFKLPLKLAVGEIYLLGFLIAIASLHQQTRSANAVNYAAHFDYFDRVVTKQIEQLDYLSDIAVATPLLHAACFPDYTVFRTKPNRSDELERWQQYVTEIARSYSARGSNGINWSDHQWKLSQLMESVGFSIGDVELYVFLMIERDCYTLFHFVSSIGGQCEFDAPPEYLPEA